MARRKLSEDQRREQAQQGGRRMVARGERPMYRVRAAEAGRWTVDSLPWLPLSATSRRDAVVQARAAIAAWLEVDPDRFDVESG